MVYFRQQSARLPSPLHKYTSGCSFTCYIQMLKRQCFDKLYISSNVVLAFRALLPNISLSLHPSQLETPRLKGIGKKIINSKQLSDKFIPLWFSHMTQIIDKSYALSIFQATLQTFQLCWSIAPLRQLRLSEAKDQEAQDQGALLGTWGKRGYAHRANKLQPAPKGSACLDAWLIVNAQGKSSVARSNLWEMQHAVIGSLLRAEFQCLLK